MRLLIFNPSNDMALASGKDEYVPTKTVQQMEHQYGMLPSIIADKDDIVLRHDELTKDKYRSLNIPPDIPITICPWGWSKPLKNKLRRFGVPEEMLPSDSYLDTLRHFSSREFWVEYSKAFGYHGIRLCNTIDEVPEYRPLILKSLWSSSGRGNHIIGREGIEGREEALLSHLKFPLVADIFYNKVVDFAMEFSVMANRVEYLGLSVFKAHKEGRYEYNYIDSQDNLTRMIPAAPSLLTSIKERHQQLLSQFLVGHYQGPVGIDMMVTENNVQGFEGSKVQEFEGSAFDWLRNQIHPCVELNLRMNMGILAIEIYNRYGTEMKTLALNSDFSNLIGKA